VSLRFDEEAAGEFYRAVEYYEAQSAGLGTELIADLDRVALLLGTNPESGGPAAAGTRRLLLSRFPFVVVYRLVDGAPVVVAFAHQRQRPGYWMDRL
jgi:plasmid stabilization system protein ParE